MLSFLVGMTMVAAVSQVLSFLSKKQKKKKAKKKDTKLDGNMRLTILLNSYLWFVMIPNSGRNLHESLLAAVSR